MAGCLGLVFHPWYLKLDPKAGLMGLRELERVHQESNPLGPVVPGNSGWDQTVLMQEGPMSKHILQFNFVRKVLSPEGSLVPA